MADCLVGNDGHAVWDIPFLRAANDWELEDFSAFFSLLYGMVIRRGTEDLSWMGSKDGAFTVKSMYTLLVGRNSLAFLWKGV